MAESVEILSGTGDPQLMLDRVPGRAIWLARAY
jgi:hypothetical protein